MLLPNGTIVTLVKKPYTAYGRNTKTAAFGPRDSYRVAPVIKPNPNGTVTPYCKYLKILSNNSDPENSYVSYKCIPAIDAEDYENQYSNWINVEDVIPVVAISTT